MFKPGNKEAKGRTKGSVNKAPLKQAMKAASEYKIMPLDFFMMNLNDPKVGMSFRLDCAKSAAPYVHRKMPIGIDDGKGGPIQFATPEQLARLSDKDLEMLQKVMEKISAMSTPGIMLSAATKAAIDEQGED